MPPDDEVIADALGQLRELEEVSRGASRPTWVSVATAHLLAAGFVLVTVGLAVNVPAWHAGTLVELLALVALYVVAYRFEFRSTAGSMVPTQPVLVAMLATGPLELVSLGVMAGILLGGIRNGPPVKSCYAWSVKIIPAWHCLGPVAILLVAGVRHPGWTDWPVLILAQVSQFALDAGSAAARMASIGVSLRTLVDPLAWTFRVDALMAVIGAGLVFSAADAPGIVRVGLAAVPVVLVRMLGQDRSQHVETALVLGAAYETATVEATCDALTGLGNRRRWAKALDQASEQRREHPQLQVAVVTADLDGLKYANDTYGHETGDKLIVEFARVLAAVAPDGAVSARLGGDEFAVLVTGEGFDGDLFLGRIREAVSACDPTDGATLSASLGWAACPPAVTVWEAARAADDAASLDKRRRRAGRSTDPPPPAVPPPGGRQTL